MSHLLAWRNPDGPEENWLIVARRFNVLEHVGKVAITEIGLVFLTTCAVVETVFYTVMSLLSYVFSLLVDPHYNFFADLLESSSFSILWGVANLILNLISINILTQELLARYWAEQFNPTPIVLFRKIDGSPFVAWSFKNSQDTRT